MKTINNVLVAVMMVLLVGFFADAKAVGLGFFLSSASGAADFEFDYDDHEDFDDDDDTTANGAGFVLDTAVAMDRVFNYRLNVGMEEVEYHDYDIDLTRTFVDQTFGFALVRHELFRFWMGPQIRFCYSNGESDYTDIEDVVGLGVGINWGANFHFGDYVSLCADIGYRIMGHAGSFEEDYGEDGDFMSGENEAFFRFSFMFRAHDVY